MKPVLYDEALRPVGMLTGASRIGYALRLNDLSRAWLTLPAGDPMCEQMRMHRFVSIFDGAEKVGLFRIIASPASALMGPDACVRYDLEHAAATLMDDFLPGYHEFGGGALTLADAMAYLLARQHTERWRPGRCAFDTRFQYKWESEPLLPALFSLATPLSAPYTWVFDTESDPWRVHLDAADDRPGAELRYGRNLLGVWREADATQLCTRLYPLGYGEGVNQLTIARVNGGVPYLDADTQHIWGVKSMPFIDKTIEDASLLLAAGRRVLEKVKQPRVAYRAKAADLQRATGHPWDGFAPGRLVRVTEEGETRARRIVEKQKPDVDGDPGDMEIRIDSKIEDAADSIARLARRAGVNELYAQGATNLYCQQAADNAEPERPLTLRFYLPDTLVRVNRVLLKWSFEPFRAYSTGAAAGGERTATSGAGGETTVTGEEGGQVSETSGQSSVETVEATGAETSVSLSGTMTGPSSPGADWLIRAASGQTGGAPGSTAGPSGAETDGASGSTASASSSSTGSASGEGSHRHTMLHTHGLNSHTHGAWHTHGLNAHAHDLTHGHGMQEHTHSFGGHTHGFGHRHDIRHTHRVSAPAHRHRVTLPAHSHQVALPAHTHDIRYGIFTGGRAERAALAVDGNPVPEAETAGETELNITPYLNVDGEGKITRGVWHTVSCAPDRLTRVVLNLFAQVFVQSVGGGDY